MNESTISTRYAKALFSFTREKNLFEKINADVATLQSAYNATEDFRMFINSPTTRISTKKIFIQQLFTNKLSNEFVSFLNLVISNKREQYLLEITKHYQQLFKNFSNIKTVKITSAQELTPQATSQIVALVEKEFNATVEIETKINTKLIGGFILRIDDQQVDASIANKLNRIKKQLKAANINQ